MNWLILFLCLNFYGKVYSAANETWWSKTSIYEIHPYSYKDSDGDGVGDIQGIISKLDYLEELGVEVLYINPLFQRSGSQDGNREHTAVVNHTNVDPVIGTVEDVEQLTTELSSRGMKLILDLSINHVHKNHVWFQKSIENIEPYGNYFVWRPSKLPPFRIPPNDWKTAEKTQAWQWNCNRNMYFYHHYTEEQPDLNLRNQNVQEEIKKIIKFWFDKGVNGFVLDSAAYYMEDSYFRNENRDNIFLPTVIRTSNIDDTFEYVQQLREYVDQYNADFEKRNERILITVFVSYHKSNMRYFGTTNKPGVHVITNSELALHTYRGQAITFYMPVEIYVHDIPEGGAMSWMTENQKLGRRAPSRMDKEFAAIFLMISMLTPGIVNIHYGQELAMSETDIPAVWGPNKTVYYQDTRVLPMQWDNSENAGFTTNKYPYQPVNPDYWEVNVESEKYNRASQLSLFKRLMQLRKTNVIKYGDYIAYDVADFVYLFIRRIGDERDAYMTLVNVGNVPYSLDLYNYFDNLPPTLKVAAASPNSGYKYGTRLKLNRRPLIMGPASTVVLLIKMRHGDRLD